MLVSQASLTVVPVFPGYSPGRAAGPASLGKLSLRPDKDVCNCKVVRGVL